eukprot:1150961-Pelagomonas_calceolata.AAC.16
MQSCGWALACAPTCMHALLCRHTHRHTSSACTHTHTAHLRRYAAMQRRIAKLHQDKAKQGAPEGPTSTATAGGTGTAPGSTESAPPLVSWAAAWRAGLQAHYNAAWERAKQRLERQALVSKANLVRDAACMCVCVRT